MLLLQEPLLRIYTATGDPSSVVLLSNLKLEIFDNFNGQESPKKLNLLSAIPQTTSPMRKRREVV